MIDRTVCLHRPQSVPAPHAMATSFEVHAPLATASVTWWLVAPVHRQTYIEGESNLSLPRMLGGPWLGVPMINPLVEAFFTGISACSQVETGLSLS